VAATLPPGVPPASIFPNRGWLDPLERKEGRGKNR
jgi:hypothetical protein